MKVHASSAKLLLVLPLTLLLGLVGADRSSAFGQSQREHFWLAGRYDGNRVIIYFDAVKFNKTVPSDARRITDPVVGGFFQPVELPASYIAQFQKRPNTEHFALGEEYDVLSGSNAIHVKLTTLVGTEGDEEVGNDSYIGALGTVIGECDLLGTEYYVVRRHREPVCGSPRQAWPGGVLPTRFAGLAHDPVRFDVQAQIVSLLTQRMMLLASDLQRHAAEGHAPAFTMQPFRVAGGSLRYYATAEWKSGAKPEPSDFSLGAWLVPTPSPRVLAVETRHLEVNLPQILNVADLGGGRTAIILSNSALDSNSIELVEYRDGADVAHMRNIQSIGAGE